MAIFDDREIKGFRERVNETQVSITVFSHLNSIFRRASMTPEGVLPYMGYIGMCGPKGYGFSAVLVINRVSILAILVINRVWILYYSLELGMFFRRSVFFIIIDETIYKSYSQIMFTAI